MKVRLMFSVEYKFFQYWQFSQNVRIEDVFTFFGHALNHWSLHLWTYFFLSRCGKLVESLKILGRVIATHPETIRPGAYQQKVFNKNNKFGPILSPFDIRALSGNDATQGDGNTKIWEPVSLRSCGYKGLYRDFSIFSIPGLDFQSVCEKFLTIFGDFRWYSCVLLIFWKENGNFNEAIPDPPVKRRGHIIATPTRHQLLVTLMGTRILRYPHCWGA